MLSLVFSKKKRDLKNIFLEKVLLLSSSLHWFLILWAINAIYHILMSVLESQCKKNVELYVAFFYREYEQIILETKIVQETRLNLKYK